MNREIKFRAWDKNSILGMIYFNSEWFIDDNIQELIFSSKQHISGRGDLNRFILMQFTGLLDKSGKEIYEGDIVWSDCSRKGVVEFYDGVFNAHYLSDEGEIEDEWERPLRRYETTVIGNRFEHPELLRNEE